MQEKHTQAVPRSTHPNWADLDVLQGDDEGDEEYLGGGAARTGLPRKGGSPKRRALPFRFSIDNLSKPIKITVRDADKKRSIGRFLQRAPTQTEGSFVDERTFPEVGRLLSEVGLMHSNGKNMTIFF